MTALKPPISLGSPDVRTNRCRSTNHQLWMLPVRRWETVSWRRVLHAFSLPRFHGPWKSRSWPKGSSNLNEMVGLQALLLCMMKHGSWHGTRKRSCRGLQATACAWMLWLFWYVQAKQRDFPRTETDSQRIGCPRVLHQQPLALSKLTEWRSMSLYGQLWQMPLLKIPACTLYLEVQILATQKEILKMEIPYNESSMTRVPIRRSAAFQFHKAAVPFTRIGPFTGAVRAATLHMWLRGWHSLLVSALRTGETTDESWNNLYNSDGGSVEVRWFFWFLILHQKHKHTSIFTIGNLFACAYYHPVCWSPQSWQSLFPRQTRHSSQDFEPPYFSPKALPFPDLKLRAALVSAQVLNYSTLAVGDKEGWTALAGGMAGCNATKLRLLHRVFQSQVKRFHPTYRKEIATKFVSVSLNLSNDPVSDTLFDEGRKGKEALPKKQSKRKKKRTKATEITEKNLDSDEDDEALMTMLETEAATGEVLFHDDFDLLNAGNGNDLCLDAKAGKKHRKRKRTWG